MLCLHALAAIFLNAAQAVPPDGALRAIDGFGVLLMAHGGGDDWNRAVNAAIEPLQSRSAIEVAFGMADAKTMQEAVTRLEKRGAKTIAVVRLFLSGESFLERTEQILGLKPGAPVAFPTPPGVEDTHGKDHTAHGGHTMAFFRVESRARFLVSRSGLLESDFLGEILADRARHLSRAPDRESVIMIGHGPEKDEENSRWLARMEGFAESIRTSAPFRKVTVHTLREDWPEKRALAEAEIRAAVELARRDGGAAIVIPLRVHGFGPYEAVLKGLEYTADKQGLLPHEKISAWIAEQVEQCRKGMGEKVFKSE